MQKIFFACIALLVVCSWADSSLTNVTLTGSRTGSIILTIWMQDLYNDGWNDNIFGFRQNGTIVATFGAGFTTGTTYGPINVTIPGNKQTQIVVSTYGTFTDEISFTVKAINGTTIFTRLSGTGRFSA